MRKQVRLLLAAGITASVVLAATLLPNYRTVHEVEGEEEEEYENLDDRYAQQFLQLRDPALGYVPADRLVSANEYTRQLQRNSATYRAMALNWTERGPYKDLAGPFGNNRAGNNGTAGIVQTILVDYASDPAGNVVLAGSPSGGLWRCTNFLHPTAAPNWAPVNDFAPNLAIAAICQNPASPNIMYIATGDANTRDIRGYGIWKSTDYGLTWTVLPSTLPTVTANYRFAFRIQCDAAGNVYVATGGAGLRRSTDGGNTWIPISPTGLTASNATYVTDLEISSTGRLHASFGYFGTKVQHYYTDNPATVTAVSGWTQGQGIRRSTAAATRLELAVQGNVLYAVTANASHNIDSCYKSVDGGATWTKQNSTVYTPSLGTGQTWYAVTLSINPEDPAEFIVGGLDAYKSSNEGFTISKITNWVTNVPYVHADHHFMTWQKVGTESRVLIGCDGGVFYSSNGGVTWKDKNENLRIKQFYSCSMGPEAGSNVLYAGAQDNGCHLISSGGLANSTEVTGGDGAFVHINQQNSQHLYGSYIYNNYRRSTNGGTSWSSVNVSSNTGMFINPWDFDDAQNTLYASDADDAAPGGLMRLSNANTASAGSATTFTVDAFANAGSGQNVSALKVSPYTANRLFLGADGGKLVRVDNAGTVSSDAALNAGVTDISGPAFPAAYLNCVNTGTNDQNLVAVFSNYGVTNVWVTNDGGSNWSSIDGNLPDMPVWWAVFVPGSNNTKMIIATEAGVYTTDAINGAATVWSAEPGFPVVRTTMLKVRTSDNLLIASTYGRGLWTAPLGAACAAPVIGTQPSAQTGCSGGTVTLSVAATGATGYQWKKDGNIVSGATSASLVLNNLSATNAGSYTVDVTGACGSTTSSAATLTVNAATGITSQPAAQNTCTGRAATFSVTASGTGPFTYQWRKGGSNITGANAATYSIASVSAADAGSYDVVVTGACGNMTSGTAILSINTGAECTSATSNLEAGLSDMVLMPSRVRTATVLRVKSVRAQKIQWAYVDAQGRTVSRFVQAVTAGTNNLSLDMSGLAAGSYQLVGTTDKGKATVIRFVRL